MAAPIFPVSRKKAAQLVVNRIIAQRKKQIGQLREANHEKSAELSREFSNDQRTLSDQIFRTMPEYQAVERINAAIAKEFPNFKLKFDIAHGKNVSLGYVGSVQLTLSDEQFAPLESLAKEYEKKRQELATEDNRLASKYWEVQGMTIDSLLDEAASKLAADGGDFAKHLDAVAEQLSSLIDSTE